MRRMMQLFEERS